MQIGKLVSVVVVVFSLAAVTAFAQSSTTGAIAGNVKDATGGVLPGVSVEVSSPALIEKTRTVVTDSSGQYKVIDLRPGTYSVSFTLPGFSTVKHEGIELNSGFTAPVSAEMRVGALEETVTVSGQTPLVDVQNVRAQNVLTRAKLDALPAGQTVVGYAAVTLGISGGSRDLGGNSGDTGFVSGHGTKPEDQHVTYDGLQFNTTNDTGGSNRHPYSINMESVNEVTLGLGSMSADTESGGVQVNYVPKDGGNNISITGRAFYTGESMQAVNITDELRARNLATPGGQRKLWDNGGAVGGPIMRDHLWFLGAVRWWGSQVYAPGAYFNLTQGTIFYTPDLSRGLNYNDNFARDQNGRLTWQASKKDKFAMTLSHQVACVCGGGGATSAPEAAVRADLNMQYHVGSWSRVQNSKLLFDAAGAYLNVENSYYPLANVKPTDPAVFDQGTGRLYGQPDGSGSASFYNGSVGPRIQNSRTFRASASYVTGAHAFKVGTSIQKGYLTTNGAMNETPGLGPVTLNVRTPAPGANPIPVSVTYWASPRYFRSDYLSTGIYVQDQWTYRRVTMNLGLRGDFFDGSFPDQDFPSGIIPGFHIAEQKGNPLWKDINPRLGVAWNITGDGKTAMKASLGRYVQSMATGVPNLINPANTLVTSATRAWNDTGDNFPQPNELGPLAPSTFGKLTTVNFFDNDFLTKGRQYQWQTTIGFQRQLTSTIGVDATYYHVQYGNYFLVDNLAVTSADYTSYCVTSPTDARLPGGGGQQVCGLADISAAARVRTPINHTTLASNFTQPTEVFNGVDVQLSARFGKGGFVTGGASTGQTTTDSCGIGRNDPTVASATIPTTQAFNADTPQNQFCHTATAWAGATQYKLNGVYPLPWDMQFSGVLQSLPGPQILAVRAYTSADIFPSLKRNLAACPSATGACTSTANVHLIQPGQQFEDRGLQVDLRLLKAIRLYQHARVRLSIDLYNAFNSTQITSRNNTYQGTTGGVWGSPTAILGGRLAKVGAQFDF